ncbi:MAG: tyrosine-type recombinase/integrase, partial [Phycisphaerales bacterium]
MASIGREGADGAYKRILFRDSDGKQKSLRLGKCSERAAQSALVGLERVHEAHRLGSTLHLDGIRWLESIDDRLHDRVVRLGLGVEPRKHAAAVTLGELLERIESAMTVRIGTLTTYQQAFSMLRDHFGVSKPINSITPVDADEWRKAITEPKRVFNGKQTRTLAPATVAKRVKVAKAVFNKALKWRLIDSNPFADLKAGSQANPERSHYVSIEIINTILETCADPEWRAIIGLSRFAGLRCPSEVAALRWSDINWEHSRLTVRSPKTSNIDGHAVRLV